ncbi:MAG: hypothetical protein SPL13_03905 [Clostridia bacterium]|nr:hypothetical protein [Clostridia bacterium]
MILKKIYVSSFGKLKDFSLEFNEGFNQINQQNGWGKTTLAVFIKSMFYGLSDGRRSLKSSERKKYRPWDSTEMFGGYVDFAYKGEDFRIERYFGTKESDDVVRLTDLKTGKEIQKNENLGKRLFSVDEDGFVSSVFFGQNDLETDGTGLTEKFTTNIGKDSQNVDEAIARTDVLMKKYKAGRGDGGIVNDLKNKVLKVEEEINTCKNAQKSFIQLEKEVKVAENELSKISDKIDKLSENLRIVSEAEAINLKKQRIIDCENKIKELNNELQNAEKIFAGRIPTDDEISAYYECFKDLEKVNNEINKLNILIAEKQTISTQSKPDKNNLVKIIMLIISAILLASGVALFFVNAVVGAIVSIISLSLFIFVLLFNKNKSHKNVEKQNDELNNNRLKELINVSNIYNEKLTAFFARFDMPSDLSFGEKFAKITESLKNILKIKSDIEANKRNLEFYLNDDSIKNENVVISDKTAKELTDELNDLRYNFTAKNRELADKRASLRFLEENASELSDKCNQLSDTEVLLKKAEEDYNVLSITKKYLISSNEEIISRYRLPMEQAFLKYLSEIDSKKVYSGTIDVNLKLTVNDNEKSRDPLFYSQGYKNLFDICKRFAFIDVLFSGEKPFVILDDPFCNLDGDKIQNSISLLKKISSEYQIIYFICHESRGA